MSVTFNKANQATLTVTGPTSVTYCTTGTATASGGSGTGALSFSAGASTGCAVVGTTVSVTNASSTCTLTATKAADGNYNQATSASFPVTLVKANAVITVTPYDATYSGAAHTAAGTAAGVESPTPADLTSLLHLDGTTHSDAGNYPKDAWTFDGNGNYNATSGTVHNKVAKANAVITVTPYDVTYNGAAHTAAVTGVGGLNQAVTPVTYGGDCTNVTVANGCTATAVYAGDGNHNGSTDSKSITITKANPTIVVTPYNVAYDTQPHTATGTATGVKGETLIGLNLSGTTHTIPGDYPTDPWTFTDVTGNYDNASGTTHDSISYGTCNSSYGAGSVILPPINSDGTSVYNRKGGSTIPVKFRVCDASGNPISNPAAVFGVGTGSITMLSAVRATVTVVNEDTIADIPDVAFRWSGTQWIFNMATSNLQAGATYTFRINLAYGNIQFRVGVK